MRPHVVAVLAAVLAPALAGCLGGAPPQDDGFPPQADDDEPLGDTNLPGTANPPPLLNNNTTTTNPSTGAPPAAPPADAAFPADMSAHDAAGAALTLTQALAAFPGVTPSTLPRFTSRLTGAVGAEPNVGVTATGTLFMTAFDLVLRSVDGGYTWGPVYDFSLTLPPPSPAQAPIDPVNTADPMLWVDPVTSRVFVAQMFPALGCTSLIWSDDDGATWSHKPLTCGIPLLDHQKLFTGPFTAGDPGALPAPLGYPNTVYLCYNKLVATNCAMSRDGGLTFPVDQPVAIEARDGCGGLNGHGVAAPDGTVYVPMTRRSITYANNLNLPLDCAAPFMAVSRDNGLSWSVTKGPDAHGAYGPDADVTVTPDGTAYILYEGTDFQQYLARSRDGFATWEGPWRVSAPGLTSTVFSAIASGDNGRIEVAYLGTRDPAGLPDEAPGTTRWHLFVASSFNAGGDAPVFLTQQVTQANDPVQIGCVWLQGGESACRNLLDFIDLSIGPEGRAYVAYTDGCVAGCASSAESNRSIVASGFLETGPSLFAARGPLGRPAGASVEASAGLLAAWPSIIRRG
jgi:hypothetical protein